jgi:hypothetical protein
LKPQTTVKCPPGAVFLSGGTEFLEMDDGEMHIVKSNEGVESHAILLIRKIRKRVNGL